VQDSRGTAQVHELGAQPAVLLRLVRVFPAADRKSVRVEAEIRAGADGAEGVGFLIVRFANPKGHRLPVPAVDGARLVHVAAEYSGAAGGVSCRSRCRSSSGR
jgi:hypothetical protein